MITNYLSRPRPIFLRVTGRPHRVGLLSLRNFSNSLRSTCTQYGPALSHNCSLFYLHITGTVLPIHSEPVLSDSVISTPVIGYCVAGCLMVRFYVFSSKCSKLYVLHVRTCMCGIKLPQRIGDHLWHVSFNTLNSEQDMWFYSSKIWKRTYCRRKEQQSKNKIKNGKYIGGLICDDLRHVYNIC